MNGWLKRLNVREDRLGMKQTIKPLLENKNYDKERKKYIDSDLRSSVTV